MISLQVLNGRIVLTGIPKHSPHYSSIPSARWDKKLMAWTYHASPIAIARIKKTMNDLAHSVDGDSVSPKIQELWQAWQEYKTDVKWKSDTGRAIAENLIVSGDYHTRTTPWPHQICGAKFIENKQAAYLAMDMGTGKTLVMIEEMLSKGTKLNLIICPKSVCAVWGSEIKTHAPKGKIGTLILDHGTSEQKRNVLTQTLAWQRRRSGDSQLAVIINYESFWRPGLWKIIEGTNWDMLIFDEAHRIKAPGAKSSKHAMRIRAPWRRGLSGTPLPNSPLDGYGQWRALDPALLGTSFAAHRARYAVVVNYKGFPEITEYRNQKQLGRLFDLQTFKVPRSVLNLPAQIESFRGFHLPVKAMRMYQEMWNDFVTWVQTGEEITVDNVLGRLMKMRQITCGFIRDENGVDHTVHEERRIALEDTLSDIPEDEHVVVFCEFKHDFEMVRAAAENLKRTYGEVSSRANDTVDGKLRDDIKITAVQPKAGGLGLNLTKSHHNIFFSTGFSLADHEQAKARTHRGGQTEEVHYIHFVATGTVDEQIYAALKGKKEVVDFVLNEIL